MTDSQIKLNIKVIDNKNIDKIRTLKNNTIYKDIEIVKPPLFYACENGNELVVKYLCEQGTNINIEILGFSHMEEIAFFNACSNGKIPLFNACKNEHEHLVKNRETPLFNACKSGNEELQGASINKTNKKDQTPSFYARKRNYEETPLLNPFSIENESKVEYLVEQGI
ncbi:hypothetical protein PIROE2DRAFT_5786 [Piromyces sp. E2]|nr:hypothetical protein PIROE2DRAFT_5786 [Piromyces sp. E2]|eukprot:OUM66928.1 hypothetical protein PIROE2DRAFT_5786 [Piromyces sp. E2]